MPEPSELEPGLSEPSSLEGALPASSSLLRGKPPTRGQFREASVVTGPVAVGYAFAFVVGAVLLLALRA